MSETGQHGRELIAVLEQMVSKLAGDNTRLRAELALAQVEPAPPRLVHYAPGGRKVCGAWEGLQSRFAVEATCADCKQLAASIAAPGDIA